MNVLKRLMPRTRNNIHGSAHDEIFDRLFEVLVEAIDEAHGVLALTGAGVSAESGLPTFRGRNGLWNDPEIERIASPQGFAADPAQSWSWYNARIEEAAKARPGPAHRALVELGRMIPDWTLCTQNVDGLDREAGSLDAIELHGNLRHARCAACGIRVDLQGRPFDGKRCVCGGLMRPDVVWFGEALPPDGFRKALEAAQRADVILSIGTSAVVMPAAALLAPRGSRALVADINPRPDLATSMATMTVPRRAGDALPELVRRLGERRRRDGERR